MKNKPDQDRFKNNKVNTDTQKTYIAMKAQQWKTKPTPRRSHHLMAKKNTNNKLQKPEKQTGDHKTRPRNKKPPFLGTAASRNHDILKANVKKKHTRLWLFRSHVIKKKPTSKQIYVE